MVFLIRWDGHSLFTNIIVASGISKNGCTNTSVPIVLITYCLLSPEGWHLCFSPVKLSESGDCSNQDKMTEMILYDLQARS